MTSHGISGELQPAYRTATALGKSNRRIVAEQFFRSGGGKFMTATLQHRYLLSNLWPRFSPQLPGRGQWWLVPAGKGTFDDLLDFIGEERHC